MSRLVIALGGNALGDSPLEQVEKAHITANAIVPLIKSGNEIVICHGNGPQVGMINRAFDDGFNHHTVPYMPLAESTAMSEGYIGYHLQQALDEKLLEAGDDTTSVVTILTQVIVDKNDPAFLTPSKPIGAFYDETTAKSIMSKTGEIYKEDSGRGWRKTVASPKPISILEYKALNLLMESGGVVIAGGGGGIPVIKTKEGYKGVDAVVDKDFTAAKIAEMIDADYLIILTAVDRVAINFGKPDQIQLDHITTEEARRYCDEGHFAPGSMLPKVQAAICFAETKKENKAIIASLEQANSALNGLSGTLITMTL